MGPQGPILASNIMTPKWGWTKKIFFAGIRSGRPAVKHDRRATNSVRVRVTPLKDVESTIVYIRKKLSFLPNQFD